MIKTFRGILADGGEQEIRLSTKKGKIGYRIVKFDIMTTSPVGSATEHVAKIFKVIQTSVTATVDFSDGNLLGVAVWSNAVGYGLEGSMGVIFDREIFNQNVFITQSEATGSASCSYYIELETMPLTDNAAAVSTLRDIRLNPQVGA